MVQHGRGKAAGKLSVRKDLQRNMKRAGLLPSIGVRRAGVAAARRSTGSKKGGVWCYDKKTNTISLKAKCGRDALNSLTIDTIIIALTASSTVNVVAVKRGDACTVTVTFTDGPPQDIPVLSIAGQTVSVGTKVNSKKFTYTFTAAGTAGAETNHLVKFTTGTTVTNGNPAWTSSVAGLPNFVVDDVVPSFTFNAGELNPLGTVVAFTNSAVIENSTYTLSADITTAATEVDTYSFITGVSTSAPFDSFDGGTFSFVIGGQTLTPTDAIEVDTYTLSAVPASGTLEISFGGQTVTSADHTVAGLVTAFTTAMATFAGAHLNASLAAGAGGLATTVFTITAVGANTTQMTAATLSTAPLDSGGNAITLSSANTTAGKQKFKVENLIDVFNTATAAGGVLANHATLAGATMARAAGATVDEFTITANANNSDQMPAGVLVSGSLPSIGGTGISIGSRVDTTVGGEDITLTIGGQTIGAVAFNTNSQTTLGDLRKAFNEATGSATTTTYFGAGSSSIGATRVLAAHATLQNATMSVSSARIFTITADQARASTAAVAIGTLTHAVTVKSINGTTATERTLIENWKDGAGGLEVDTYTLSAVPASGTLAISFGGSTITSADYTVAGLVTAFNAAGVRAALTGRHTNSIITATSTTVFTITAADGNNTPMTAATLSTAPLDAGGNTITLNQANTATGQIANANASTVNISFTRAMTHAYTGGGSAELLATLPLLRDITVTLGTANTNLRLYESYNATNTASDFASQAAARAAHRSLSDTTSTLTIGQNGAYFHTAPVFSINNMTTFNGNGVNTYTVKPTVAAGNSWRSRTGVDFVAGGGTATDNQFSWICLEDVEAVAPAADTAVAGGAVITLRQAVPINHVLFLAPTGTGAGSALEENNTTITIAYENATTIKAPSTASSTAGNYFFYLANKSRTVLQYNGVTISTIKQVTP